MSWPPHLTVATVVKRGERYLLVEEVDQPLDEDIVAARWLTRAELDSRQLRSPLVRQSIDDFESRELAPLSFLRHPE